MRSGLVSSFYRYSCRSILSHPAHLFTFRNSGVRIFGYKQVSRYIWVVIFDTVVETGFPFHFKLSVIWSCLQFSLQWEQNEILIGLKKKHTRRFFGTIIFYFVWKKTGILMTCLTWSLQFSEINTIPRKIFRNAQCHFTTDRKICLDSYHIKPKSDCIYYAPIDLEPNGRPFGSKSICTW